MYLSFVVEKEAKYCRLYRPALTCLLLLSLVLVACAAPEAQEVTRVVAQEVEVTRTVEQEVTRVVTEEVTRIVEQLVETVITATPEEVAVAESVDATVDRVGFPAGYQDEFTIFYEFDRPDNRSARVIYANDIAASVTADQLASASVNPGTIFPYGSVLVMEVYRTERDDGGNVLLDENGRYVRGDLFGLFVMRKEPGFGAKYGPQRNGEWEYTSYRPDGSVLTPPEATTACAACHVEAGQGRDWVFGGHLAFGFAPVEPGENEIGLVDYTFTPSTITVTVGTEVTWVSSDVVFHTVTVDSSFSRTLRPNSSTNFTFEEAGTFPYFCAIHPQMTGQVVVVEE